MTTTDPTPPAFEDERTEGGTPRPSVTADGISWKAAGAVLVVLLGVAVSWGALNTKMDTVLAEVREMRQVQTEQGEWIAAAKWRLDAVEGALKRAPY